METPGPGAVHHCEGCGYELPGLGESGECPECGRPFNAWVPFVIGRPVRWRREVVRMCWPAAGAGLGLVALVKLMGVWLAAGMLLPAVFVLWVGLAVGFPAAIAREVADRHWIRPKRKARSVVIGLAGAAANVVILLVIIMLARMI